MKPEVTWCATTILLSMETISLIFCFPICEEIFPEIDVEGPSDEVSEEDEVEVAEEAAEEMM